MNSERVHGTRAKYVVEKCRCIPCTEANRAYARERDRRTRRPDEMAVSAFVPAGPFRAHLLELSAAGVGYKRVARQAGVAASSLLKVATGERSRVRRETAERVMAVSPAAAADGAYVDAAKTWERIDRLLAAGWSKVEIAREVHGPQAKALQLRRTRVTAAHARAVERLVVTLPESDTDLRLRLREAAADLDRFFSEMAEVLEARLDPWRRDAACRHQGIPVGVFFVGRGQSVDPAREVCARCPVRVECAAEAEGRRVSGVWGGLSERERRGQAEMAA